MKLLIDTHIFLWSLLEPEKLSSKATKILENPNNTILVSIVSIWESSIKKSLGKLEIPDDFSQALSYSNFGLLELSVVHCKAITKLPWHHRDPFDRMLIAQTQKENLTLMTHDKRISLYDAKILVV